MKAKTGMRPTTTRLRPIDDENATAVIRSGMAKDLSGAIRFGLALARRFAESKGKTT